MKSRVLAIAALSLTLPAVAFAAAKDTPAGIEKQCETYGYIGEGELVDEILDVGDDLLGKIGDDPDDEVDIIGVEILDGGRVVVTGVPGDADDVLILGHSDGLGGGDDEDLDILSASIAPGEGAIFTVSQDGDDAILTMEVRDEDGSITAAKTTWEGGGCNYKGLTCTYSADLVRYTGSSDDDTNLHVDVHTESTAKGGDPIRVVKVVKSITGLG